MLAVALQANVAQHDQLVIALDLIEGSAEDVGWILLVARKELRVGTGHPTRCALQAFSIGVIAGPSQQGADSLLGFFSGRLHTRARFRRRTR